MTSNAAALVLVLMVGIPASAQQVRSHAKDEPFEDVTPPAMTDSLLAQADGDVITLSWISAGDDDTSGTPSYYDIRGAKTPITDETWETAIWIGFFPTPAVAGSGRWVTLEGLEPDMTYYFALKTGDNASLESPLSNVAEALTGADTTPPGTITTLAQVEYSETATSVDVTWTVPSHTWGSGVTGYDLRWCPTENGDVTVLWDDPGTTAVLGEPLFPAGDGGQELMTIFGLQPGRTYSVAVRARDGAWNWSELPSLGSLVATLQPAPPPYVKPAKGSGAFKSMDCAASGSSAGWACLLPLALLGLRRIGT